MLQAIKTQLKEKASHVEAFLQTCLKDSGIPSRLREAMEYSLLAGGKRLRPVLCLTTADMFGVKEQHAMPFAAALEMIHTYSLIHDDMPEMDNDDLRRGRPTCHKAFDPATALLAGDALLTDAFRMMLVTGENLPADRVLRAVLEAAWAVGGSGMVGGQILDLDCTGKTAVPLTTLQHMHALKTGAPLRAACTTGAILGGADASALAAIAEFGAQLGLAFQIVDDILDVTSDAATLGKTPGKDAAQGKTTYPSLLGLDESRKRVEQASAAAINALSIFVGTKPQADFLVGVTKLMAHRVA